MLLGDNFEIKQSAYQEETISDLMPKDLVLYHALEKGRDVAEQLDEGVIISADTIVVFNNQILGKPYSQEKAREMLKKISGNVVEAISGVAVIDVKSKKELQEYEITKVKMKEMSDKEIDDYITINYEISICVNLLVICVYQRLEADLRR